MSEAKRIVVTGASSGIGEAVARRLAADGHALYVCARRADRLDALTREQAGIAARPCDVADEAQVVAFVEWLRTKAGRVDALVNAAGGFGAIGPMVETDSLEWRRTIEANLYGTYLMTKHVVPLMPGQGGRIVNFSGGGGLSPFPRYSAYAASKAAVIRLTETLAMELAPRGIAVNAVAPGFVATEIHAQTLRTGAARAGAEHFERTRRLLREGAVPMEVPVSCIQFLLSDRAAGLTGKTISASFDPWAEPAFVERLEEMSASDVYTLRRLNPANLPPSGLREALLQAQGGRAGRPQRAAA